jgi:hypothetical protein
MNLPAETKPGDPGQYVPLEFKPFLCGNGLFSDGKMYQASVWELGRVAIEKA